MAKDLPSFIAQEGATREGSIIRERNLIDANNYETVAYLKHLDMRNEPKMVVMDATSGKVITSFPIGRGVDYASFDTGAKLIFFSCSEGVLNIFHEKSSDEYEDAGAVKTQPSAKTMAFDPKTKKIFLSAAEYTETPATTPGGRPQRTVKPGSFVVLVVSK